MTKPRSRAHEFIEDVAAGISDEALKAKYRVSGKRFVLAKAAAQDAIARHKVVLPEVEAKLPLEEVLDGVKAGVSNDELMNRFGLTARELQSIFREIIQARLCTPLELSDRLSMTTSQVVEAFALVGKMMMEDDDDG